ncbi:glycoside hydrolase family 16 protein [Phenylobacterium deserti]|uniref:Glycoside hydrolase family 16 protein n=1 Tax=Phenylobacterium deserti TaxID=1914756 RepID=A0A328ABG4_9CAUL|nr:glycoside hydrolase family 16 protein [Phenylobacterium deserti]RAK50704.1 glycoside hydrolase family 16 protein [Phenylobacterium deserti]
MQTKRTVTGRSRTAGAGAAVLALALAACLRAGEPAAAATPPLTKAPDGRPLQLTFADEFDSFRRFRNGQGVWRTTFRDGNDVFSKSGKDDFELRTLKWNKELQLYVDPDMPGHAGPHGDHETMAPMMHRPLGLDPFKVGGGTLTISVDRTPAALESQLGGFRYISGLITTQPSFHQQYGYFEMRAKLPRGKGIWPAFWLLPLDLSWPPEIDVMESIGDPSTVFVNAHSKVIKAQTKEVKVSPDDFHTYAVAWDRQNLTFFIDGRQVDRRPTPGDMHKPMYMLANVAVGGDWAGQPDASTRFPAGMTIDYIRAYRFAR